MLKKLLKPAAVLLAAALVFSLCGCDSAFPTPDSLLSPPSLTGDLRPISDALAQSIAEEYTFVYPSSGDIRSPIALEDVDGDGVKEAFAFYSTNNGDGTDMHINYVKKTAEGWRSVADNVITAGGVEKVIISDLSGNGRKEILVGWEVYGSSEKKLGIYSAADDRLYERLMEQYTTFTCCDLTGNGKQELILQYLNSADYSNIASIYTLSATGVNRTAGCLLDGKVKSVSEPVVSKLSDGTPALFIDEEKGAGNITEVLFMKDGRLVNPLLDEEKGENLVTQRISGIYCTDIDNDGSAEIPTAIEAPLVDSSNEKIYFTNWCSYDGETLTVKVISLMNQTDGYYLVLPAKLIDGIALSRNAETRTRTFYEYNSETGRAGRKMFCITATNTAGYEKFADENRNAQIIYEDEQTVYTAEIFSGGAKLTLYDIKEMFRIME